MSNKIKNIRAVIHEMAQADILDMVDPSTLARIKALDDNPLVKVYAVGHEGESEGRVLGVGNVVKKWTRPIIEKLHTAIQEGVGLFLGHGDSNDNQDRRRLGEVVGKKVVEEGGKLKALVATWFYPSTRDECKDLDLCSIETEIDFKLDGDQAVVKDVLPVSGIALGKSSDGMVPGFPESGLIASLQMFAEKGRGGIQEEKMDVNEIKKHIIDENLNPGDLFSGEVILAVDIVTKAIDEAKHDAEGYGERWKKKANELEEENAKLNGENMVPKEDLEKANETIMKLTAVPTVRSIAKELELSDKESAFLEKRIDGFNPDTTDEAEIKVKAKEFVEAQRKEFAEVSEIIDPESKSEEINIPSGDGSGEGKSENPFLPDEK